MSVAGSKRVTAGHQTPERGGRAGAGMVISFFGGGMDRGCRLCCELCGE